MAFKAKTGGNAVADIKALFVLLYDKAKFGTSSAEKTRETCTLQEMIDAKLNLTSGQPGDAWVSLLTLRGSVNAGQDAPSMEKILVDQHNVPIGITSEPGDFNFSCNLPSFAKDDLTELGINVVDAKADQTIDPQNTDLALQGLNLNGEQYDCAIMAFTRTNHTIVFPHAQIAFSFSKEDKVFVINCTGQVLAPLSEKIKCPVYVSGGQKAV